MAKTDDSADKPTINVFVAFRKSCGPVGGSQLRVLSVSTMLSIAYVGIGIAVYHSVETKGCDDAVATCRWSVIDAIYFCTVTMSTVGYGDLSPSTPETKVVCAHAHVHRWARRVA